MPESRRPTIYSRLHEARASLERLKDVPTHRLHLLDEQTAAALQPSSSSSSTTSTSRPPLSRADFHDVLSSLRQATRSFAESVKPLTAASHDGLSTSSSANLDRYTSLLREQSQHVAQLASSLDPIESLARLARERDAKTLPPSLYVGALRHTAAPLGKRKRSEGDDAGQQAQASLLPSSVDEAVAIVTALSSATDTLAKSLGLETFAEAHPVDKESAGKGGEVNTHTLTLGGRILVIDIDLGVQAQQLPLVKVRVSFATDSAAATQVNGTGNGASSSVAESSSHATKNAKLAAVLRGDVEDIARQLFGTASSAAEVDSADVSIEEHRIRQAITSWQKLGKNLAALARIDQLSGSSSSGKEPSNLFAQLGQLHEAVSTAAGKSELPCDSIEVQEVAPFTRITLRDAQPPLALDLSIDQLSHGGDEEQGRDDGDGGRLGPLPGRHLSFVARLDPPLVLPRKLAARLGSMVGGAAGSSTSTSRHQNVLNGHNEAARPRSTASASPSSYSSLLSSATHLAPSNTAAQATSQQRVKLVPSLDDGDYPNAQGTGAVLVSFFPFQSPRQLFAAIALLQQGSALGRLLRPVVIRSVEDEKAEGKGKLNGSDQAEKREVTLEEMLKPPTGPAVVIVSLEDAQSVAQSAQQQPVGIKLTSQLWDSKSEQMVYLTGSVRIEARGGLEVKARLTPDVGMALGFGGDGAGADDDTTRELDSEEAAKMAEQLASSGDLQQACEAIVKWAQGGEEEEQIEQAVEPVAATEVTQAPKQEDEDIVMAQDEEAAAESSALSTPGPAPPQAAPVPMDEDKAAIVTAPAPTTTSAPIPRADSPPSQSEATVSRATKSPSRASPTSPPPTRPMMTRRRSRQQSDDATVAAAAAAAATRARSPPPPLTIAQSSATSSASGTSTKGATVSPTAGRRRSSGRGASPGVGGDDQRKRSPTVTRKSAAANASIKKEEEGTPPLQSPTSPSFSGGPATRRRSQSSRGAG